MRARFILVLGLLGLTTVFAANDDAAASKASPTPHRKKHSTTHRFPKADSSATPEKKPFRRDDDSDAEASPTPTPTSTSTPTPTPTPTSTPKPNPTGSYAANATLTTDELTAFDEQPTRVQHLLTNALELTQQGLTYLYGSSDPANGGMDCSGFIYHTLQQEGVADVPRDASGQYVWLRKAGTFRAVVSRQSDSFELNELRPGDLLFWTGTYDSKKDPPVTHTMIYLGREKKSGQRVMVGSSDGRSYEGKRRWGVSVFDFKMPGIASQQKGVDFIGYAHLPGFGPEATPTATSAPSATPEPSASVRPKSKTKRARPRSGEAL